MSIVLYKTYSFKDKDPMIDKLRTVLQDEFPGARKGGSKINYGVASSHTGVSETTLRNWFEGDTRRPQFASMCATARGAGHDLVLIPTTGKIGEELERIIKRTNLEARQERQSAKNGHAKVKVVAAARTK